jgi:hypothetical protein
LRNFPDLLLGREDEVLHPLLQETGLQHVLDTADIALLAGQVAQQRQSQGSALTDAHFSAVLRELAKEVDELRCACCGYWFTSADVSESRLELVRHHGLGLAGAVAFGRRQDPLKSPTRTSLHLDHILPRSRSGRNDARNLQVYCEFCNGAKLNRRFPAEALSILLDAAQNPTKSDRYYGSQLSVRISVFTTILYAKKCAVCERGPRATELTARSLDPNWVSPWTLRCTCYECD